jgi:hypothetical protein
MQPKPEYETIKEANEIFAQLLKKYPAQLLGIEPGTISFCGIINKEPKENKPLFELKSVPFPIRLDCPYDFYVVVNMKDWDSLNKNHKAALVFKALLCISREEPGKVVPFDLKDHSVIVRTLGVDYMSTNIPNILEEDIVWKEE